MVFEHTKLCQETRFVVYYTQRNRYNLYFNIIQLGSETLTPSNISQRMGFTFSIDSKNWVNYWFVESNYVSVT